MSCIALKPAALSPQRFSPFSGRTSPPPKLMSIKAPPPAKPAALTPARPEQPPPPTPDTAANAAAEKKDFASLTSRTVAGPNAPSRAAGGARARDAKSMPKATGRWTAEEHDEFLKCLDIYGREWKKVAERITTRTAAQIRSHAQKYFKKIEAAGEGAPKAAKPAAAPLVEGAAQIPAETLAGALGALDDMLRALRSKRARYEDDQTPSEAASDASDAPPVEKRPRAASEGLVIPQAKRSRANSDDRAPGLRRRVTCDDLRALEALELLREAAGGAF
jgi:SHAQKYF class myb-like DNA-binding protein